MKTRTEFGADVHFAQSGNMVLERLEERIVLDGSESHDGKFHFLYYDDNHFFVEDMTTGEWYYYDNLNSQTWEPYQEWFTDSNGASSYNDWDYSQYWWDANHYLAQSHADGAWLYYDNVGSQTWEPYQQWFTDSNGASSYNDWDYSQYWWDANHCLAQDHTAGAWLYYDNLGSQTWEPYHEWFTDSNGASSYNDWDYSQYWWDANHYLAEDHAAGAWLYYDNVGSQTWEPYQEWFTDSNGATSYNDWDVSLYWWDANHNFAQDHTDGTWLYYDNLDNQTWEAYQTWFDDGTGLWVYNDWDVSYYDLNADHGTCDSYQDHELVDVDGVLYVPTYMVSSTYTPHGSANQIVYGTSDADTIDLTGGSQRYIVYAGDGDDTVTGSAQADRLYGGLGNDTLTTSGSGDLLNGEEDNDTLSATGTASNNTLNGGRGDDSLSARESASGNTLNGEEGEDHLSAYGNAQGNVLNGHDGTDLYEDFLPDTLKVYDSASGNTLNGGEGFDYLYAYRNAQDNVLNGDGGEDWLLCYGNAQGNVLNGHDGTGGGTEADWLRVFGSASGNTLNGDGGSDDLIADNNAQGNVLNGHDGTGGGTEYDGLSVYGSASGNTLNGEGGADLLHIGSLGTYDTSCTANILNGGDGDDHAWADSDTSGNTFNGNAGNDTMTDEGSNTFYP